MFSLFGRMPHLICDFYALCGRLSLTKLKKKKKRKTEQKVAAERGEHEMEQHDIQELLQLSLSVFD